ncbi:DUF695 domain-containing protein [Terrimonas sp. NA20]|uniref:DUF695 domain-containing protein n=1 Tax=Terrimonas ginsenosidimutans TaxID=2908004 RepID=A0ABS9KQJ9_9BACT|nr:DUF695 domain-containing protein [Terrimonas ginsenosidimutans]MCG2614581.1 DUF695 domain-containing protein [Terrimonas ginsenosidimutans]
MNFLKRFFGKKDRPVKNYTDFWNWFLTREKFFFATVKKKGNIEKDFFNDLAAKLAELKEGYFFLTGMFDDDTVELVFTADSNLNNIVFVEELVSSAPGIAGWKFTALKAALNVNDIGISMGGYKFSAETLSFYSEIDDSYPDEINITVCHPDFTEENKSVISNGVFIFLEHILGELDFVNNIDEVHVTSHNLAKQELIPITKLQGFLSWRQREFVEKYEDATYDTEVNDRAILEAKLENGNALIATINTELLRWDRKASHPWVAVLVIKYDGSKGNGMPDSTDYELFNQVEEKILAALPDHEGYLNIGRQTADGIREIYFACRDFRKPSKIFYQVQQELASRYDVSYEIYQDKYWRSFERFHKE